MTVNDRERIVAIGRSGKRSERFSGDAAYLQDNPASIEVQKPQCDGTWACAREPPA